MSLRDQLARSFAGGPEFRVLPDRFTVAPSRVGAFDELDGSKLDQIQGELEDLDLSVKKLDNLGVIVAEAERLDDLVETISQSTGYFKEETLENLRSARGKAVNRSPRTSLGLGILNGLNFEEDPEVSREARLRSFFTETSLKNELTDVIEEIDGVGSAELAFTRTTFGPLNLNVDVFNKPDLLSEGQEIPDGLPDLNDVVDKSGASEAWEDTRGEDCIVAIFDTSFCEDFFSSQRVLDEFSGPDVESAYSAPGEAHGTMTAYAAAGNSDENDLDVDGIAPEADMLLARLSDSNGQLKYIEEAWEWLSEKVEEYDRPIISNHSYGTPLCSGRTMSLCDKTTTKVVDDMNSRDDHQAFYAAGNEAMYCGHRMSGVTNGIMGANSLPSSIAVAALRYDLNDAQNYSSHGYGTCSGIDENPKPDVGFMLPSVIPYGCKLKDMSSGRGGSSGGTSLASPLTAGAAALVASASGTADQDVIEDALESTAENVRRNQMSAVGVHNARFGNGQVRVSEAVNKVLD